jgi:hypothetical protein
MQTLALLPDFLQCLLFHPEDTGVPPKRPSTYTRLIDKKYLASRLSRIVYRGDATTRDLQSVSRHIERTEELRTKWTGEMRHPSFGMTGIQNETIINSYTTFHLE